MGAPLVSFPDFQEATGPSVLRKPEDLVNDAVAVTYSFWRLLVGHQMSELVKGGTDIRDWIMLNVPSTFMHYQVNDIIKYASKNSLTRWSGPWRFSRDYIRWTDQETDLNDPEGMTDEAIFQQYKDFKFKLEQELWTSFYNGLENAMWAVPDRATMEDPTGKVPYSLPVFCNEGPNRLFNYLGGTGQWTQVQGIDPTLPGKERWKNHLYAYNSIVEPKSAAVAPVIGAKGVSLLGAMREAYTRAGYKPPRTSQRKYFEDEASMAQKVIFTSSRGAVEAGELMQMANDRWQKFPSNDGAMSDATFGGVDIVPVDALDTATLYANVGNTALVTEGDANAAGRGPRFYCFNGKYTRAVFSRNHYFKRTPVMTPYDQPNSHVQVVDLWHNTITRSRMRIVMVSPGSVAGRFPTQTYTPAQIYAAY